MRKTTWLLLAWAALMNPLVSLAQDQDAATGSALSELQALRAAQGAPVETICGTGTITVIGTKAQHQYPFHSCANHHAMRSDTSLTGGIRTAVFNGRIGVFRSADGRHTKVSGRNGHLWRPIYFPPLLLSALLADEKMVVQDHVGSDAASPAPHLHLQRSELFNKSSGMQYGADDVSIQVSDDKKTATSISWRQSLEGKGMQIYTIPEAANYTDYISVSGVLMPQTITTSECGAQRTTVHFTSIEINPSLPSDFFDETQEEAQ